MKIRFSTVQSGMTVLLGALILAGVSASATAANIVWSNGNSGLWGNTGQWVGGLVPQNGDDVYLANTSGNGQTSWQDFSTLSLNSLTYNGTATGSFSLFGNRLTLGGGGFTVNAGAPGLTMALDFILGANQTWTSSSTNVTTVNGTVFNGGNTLTVGGTGNFLFNAPIVGNGGITKNGTSTLTLTMFNTANAGNLTINAGSISATQTQLAYYGGTISGAGNFTKDGTGTLVLTNNNNSYTGTTRINNGVLVVGSIANADGTNSALGAPATTANGTITMSSAGAATLVYTGIGNTSNRVISLGGTSTSTLQAEGSGNLVLTSDFTTTVAGNKTLTLRGLSGSPTNYNGVINNISGAIVNYSNTGTNFTSLTKTDPGIWKLSANNDGNANGYTGNTTISGGVLLLGDNSALKGQMVSGSPTGTLLVFSNTISYLGASTGVLGLSGNFVRSLGTTGNLASVYWTGSGGFAAYGADRIVNIGGGTSLTWNATGFVPTNSTLILSAPSATNQVEFQNPISLFGAARTIQVDNGAAPVDAVLSGITSNGTLVKTGAGTLSMNAVNTFNTGLTVNDGVLQLDYTTGPAGARIGSGTPVTLGGGNLTLLGNATMPSVTLGALTLNTGASTFNFVSTNAAATVTLAAINRNAVANQGGTVNFILPGAPGVNGNLTTTTANPALNTVSSILGGYAVANGADWATASGTTPFKIAAYSGYPALLDSTPGNYVANFLVTGNVSRTVPGDYNTLKLTSDNTGQSLALVGDNTLTMGGLLFTGANDYTITGGTLRGAAVGTFGVATNLNGELIVHQYGAGNLRINSNIADNIGVTPTNAFTATPSNLTGGTINLTKSGPGTLVLSGYNTYSGTTYINSGNVILTSARAIPPYSPVVLANLSGAALNLTTNASIGNLSGGGLSGGNINLGTSVLSVNQMAGTAAASYNGVISGAAGSSLVLQGAQINALNLTGQITGATSITMNGVNTVAMSANYGYSLHNFNGGFTLNSGYLNLGPMSSVGMNPVIAGPLGTGTFTINGGLITNATNAININNPVTVGGNFLVDISQALALNGDVNLGNANRAIGLTNAALTMNGKITGTGSNAALTVNWAGYGSTTAGILNLNNPESNFAGGVTVNRYARLQVGASGDSALTGSPIGTGTLTLAHQSFFIYGTTAPITIYNPITIAGDFFTGPSSGGCINWAGPITLSANPNGHTDYASMSTGTVLLSGNISGSGGLSFVFNSAAGAAAGSYIISGNNSFTGNTSIRSTTSNSSPTVTFDYSTYNTNKLDPGSTLNLSVRTTLVFQGNASADTSQTISGINLDYGAHSLTFTRAGTQALNANLGTINRGNAASINFTLPTSGNITVTNNATNGILPPWITVGTNWATVNVNGNVTALATYNGNLPNSIGDSTYNYNNTALTTLTGSVVANSLRFNVGTAGTYLDLMGNSLTLTSGGILSNGNTVTIADSVGTGTIGSSTGELIIRDPNDLIINAGIAPGTTTLTRSGGGYSPRLTLSGNITALTTINSNDSSFTISANTAQNFSHDLRVNMTLESNAQSDIWAATTDMGGNNLTYYLDSGQTGLTVTGNLTNVKTLNILGPNNIYLTSTGGAGPISVTPVAPGGNCTISSIYQFGRASGTFSANTTLTGLSNVTLGWNNGGLTLSSNLALTQNLTYVNQSLTAQTVASANITNLSGNNRIFSTGLGAAVTFSAYQTGLGGAGTGLGANALTLSGIQNSGSGVAYNADVNGVAALTISNTITAGNLNVTGSGMHPWHATQGAADQSRARLTLSGSTNAFSGNTNITNAYVYLDYATQNNNKISSNGVLTMSSALLYTNPGGAAITQTVGSTVLNANNVFQNNGGNITLDLKAITANPGATVDFRTSVAAANVWKTTNSPVGDILGGWATLYPNANPATFVSVSGNTTGVPALTTLTAPVTNTGVSYTYTIAGNTFLNMSTADTSINALRVLNTADRTGNGGLDFGIASLTLTSGGLLCTGSSATNIILKGTGTIRGADANSPLYVHVDNNSSIADRLIINNPLIDSGAGTGTGYLVKANLGQLIVTAPATYTGGTYINGGVLTTGNLQAASPSLSSGQLTLQSGGSLGAYGSFTRNLTASATPGSVTFGPGGGGFSAEGGPLTVSLNVGGVAGGPVTAAQLNRYLVLNNHVTSTNVVDFQNAINIDGGMTIAVGAFGYTADPGTSSNYGAAYSKVSGTLSGNGNLLVYGYGNNSVGSTGLLVPTGGLNYTGDTIINGASLYLSNPAQLPGGGTAGGNLMLIAGGTLSTRGTFNGTIGSGPGQIQWSPVSANGGFAAVGGPLAVTLAYPNTAQLLQNSNGFANGLALGNAFSTHAVDFQSDFYLAGAMTINSNGPVANIISGKISGANSAALTIGSVVKGGGILTLSNPNNDFMGQVSINLGTMLRATNNATLGAPGGGLISLGTFDLNGNSFDNEPWIFPTNNSSSGPIYNLPTMVNFNTATTSTWGSQSPNANIVINNVNLTSTPAFGGPGNLTVASNFVGYLYSTFVNNTLPVLNKRGTGTLTLQGDTTGLGYGGSNIAYGTRLTGGTTRLDFSINTNNKLPFGFTGTGVPYISLNQATLEMDGNASAPTTQNLIQTIGNNVAVNASTSLYPGLTLANPGGANVIKVATVAGGQDTTLELYNLIRTMGISQTPTLNFVTDNSTYGGNATIKLSGAGIPLITSGGSGYTPSATVPITISGTGSGAAGYAVTNAAGNISAICITNAGSGYTTAPTITFATGNATAILYTNNPVTGILGGYATFNGTSWAYRDPTTGYVAALPFSSSYYQQQNDVTLWTANKNITTPDGAMTGFTGNVTATLYISTLRFGEPVPNNTVNIGNGGQLRIGLIANTAAGIPVMSGGILVTSNVGINDTFITGNGTGTLTTGSNTNDSLFIHQYNPSGNLTIAANIVDNNNFGLTKDGPGTLILTGTNTFAGGMSIYDGVVSVPTLANVGANQPAGPSQLVYLQGGSTLRVTGNSTSNKLIQVSTGDGTIEVGAGATLTLTGNLQNANTATGGPITPYTVAVNSGDGLSNLTLTGAGTGIVTGSIQLTKPYDWDFLSTQGASAVVEGVTQLTKDGSGTWTLNPTPVTFSGNTYQAVNAWQGGTVIKQGTLALGAAWNCISPNGPVTINSTGTLDLLTNPEVTGEIRLNGGAITGNVAGGAFLYGRAYSFQSGNVNVPLGGDTSTIIKTTPGTVTMTGNSSTFAGGVQISGGTLLINNSVGSGSGTGSVVVYSGGTLGGLGIIGPAGTSNVSILSGAQLSPGDPSQFGGIGTLTMTFGTGKLDLQAGANLIFDLATTANSDMIQIGSGSVQFSGSQTWSDFTFNPQTGFNAGVYTLMTTSSGITGWSSDLTGLVGGYTGTLSVSGSNNLILTVVPEPGTLALLAFGSLAVLHRRKKKAA